MKIDLKKLTTDARTHALSGALTGKAGERPQWGRQFADAGKPKAGKRPCN